MSVSLIIKKETFTVISAYAPHAGLSDAEKKSFWELLDEVVRGCPADHRLIIGGDLNGHIGVEAEGYEGAHGGFGFGPRNEEGRSIVEFAIAHELVVANSFFKKRDAQLATFYSGGRCTQIDFFLLRKGELRTCRDCKVLPAYTCSSQHRLLIMDLVTRGRVRRRAKVVQHRIIWKNLHGAKAETFRMTVADRLSVEGDNVAPANVDQLWNRMASTIREVAKEALGMALGTSRAHKSSRESWWLSDDVQTKVALKQMRFRELITFGEGTTAERTRVEERYKEAKREAKKAVAIAKDKAYEDLYRKLDSKEGANDIYRIAKARERRGRDLVNVKYIKDEAGQSIVREDLIKKRWEEYFASLFGRERTEWNEELREVREYQNNCYCTRINQEEVRSALRKMGRNKAVGPDQIPIEAWRCLGGDGVRWLTNLFNTTFRSAKMPMEWRLNEVIPIYKNKGDAQICSNYRGIKFFYLMDAVFLDGIGWIQLPFLQGGSDEEDGDQGIFGFIHSAIRPFVSEGVQPRWIPCGTTKTPPNLRITAFSADVLPALGRVQREEQRTLPTGGAFSLRCHVFVECLYLLTKMRLGTDSDSEYSDHFLVTFIRSSTRHVSERPKFHKLKKLEKGGRKLQEVMKKVAQS
ncbi:uncharacterized protein [Rutidosis leptorrhynchoides]|uniref:uncharacterized protein n=1 Tax=Rutidosis leptorrhynchoides TaxID=125765 RepID=UPI003A9981D5